MPLKYSNKAKLVAAKEAVIIDSITHLGRSTNPIVPGAEPRKFPDGASLSIQFSDPTKKMSVDQAIIYPPGTPYNQFSIRGLGSANPTFLNDFWVSVSKATPLEHGDDIDLGGAIKLRFELEADTLNPNHALMVAHSGRDLSGRRSKDIYDLTKELKKRGFEGNIETLVEINATREAILRKLEFIKRKVTKNSLFVFHFAGHGSKEGELCLDVGDLKERLSPDDLFKALDGFRGQVLLILDACYTSAVADQKLPPRIAVIGHKGLGYSGGVTGVSPYDRRVRGFTTRAICKALQANEHTVDVKKLIEIAQQYPRIMEYRQEVELKGASSIEFPTDQFFAGQKT